MTYVSDFIDVSDPAALEDAVARAREVLADRGCVVLPTDTVYGIGADAFSPLAVAVLLALTAFGVAPGDMGGAIGAGVPTLLEILAIIAGGITQVNLTIGTMIASLQAEDPEAQVLPFMLGGGTDNKSLSRLGITGYGFAPMRLPADLAFTSLFHGIDERVPVDALEFGCRVLERMLEPR